MPEKTDLLYHLKKERRKRVRQAKVPWLSECIQSLRFRSVSPREEACVSADAVIAEVDVRESQSTNQSTKGLGWERPIRQRLESRHCVRQEILLR